MKTPSTESRAKVATGVRLAPEHLEHYRKLAAKERRTVGWYIQLAVERDCERRKG